MLLKYKIQTRLGVTFRKFYIKAKYIRRKNKCLFSHVTYYAVGNAGDTVLSECVRKTVERRLMPSSWNLISVNKPVNENLIKKINSTKALFIGGGGLFLPDSNENSVSGWQWACHKDLLNKINVPVFLYSVGYNYFRGQLPSDLFVENLNEIVSKSSFVGLRNTGSVNAVKKLISAELRDKVCFQPCTTTIIRNIFIDLPQKTVTRKVAFNIAFDRMEMRFGLQKEKILAEIAECMTFIAEKGYKVYVIAHCSNDLLILPYIKNRKNICTVNASHWDFSLLVKFYNDMDMVIGMRGHAQMIPFGCNCHIISLGTHDKMKWFLEDIGASDWYIDINENPDNLCETILDKFHDIHELHGEETTRRLLESQKKLYDITCDNMQKIKSILEDSEK